MAYDLVIENGRIVDGTGRAEFPGGVAVSDGKIVEVGDVSGAAKRRIDAKGLVIAPGIVDIHTHYDAQVLWDPLLTSSVWHGVTTVVMGNCGFTIAPCKPDDQDYIMRMLARVEGMSLGAMQQGPEWDWRTFGEYMERVGQSLGLNAACQVGHSALRYTVMGSDALEREATPDEVEAMCGLLREALAAGADAVMIGNLFAGTDESPGELVFYQNRSYKTYRGMGSLGALTEGTSDRYGQDPSSPGQKVVPEGIEGRVPYKGRAEDLIPVLLGGLQSGMGYCGVRNVRELQTRTRFFRVTHLGLRESHAHDVVVTKEAPNYRVEI